MKDKKAAPLMILVILIFFLWACGGGGSSGSATSSTSSGSPGSLSLTMVDAPGGTYQAVYVTIKEVQVCMRTMVPCDEDDDDDCGCRWKTVATLNQTFNLLELVNGVVAALGTTDLAAGTYNQMRLLLHDEPDDSLNLFDDPHPWPQYLIDEDGDAQEMKVPSGYQTGIKLVHPFVIENNLTTELILDFDVARSVVKAGNSGKYLLKPTIKVIGTYNRATVSGVVTDDDTPTPNPIERAMVTAWYEDADGNWIAAMSTLTDADGGYTLYLGLGGDVEQESKEYQIVALAEGYNPGCRLLQVEMGRTYSGEDAVDFVLSPVEMVGTVSGTVTGTAPAEDGSFPVDPPLVTVSFSRYVGNCIREPVEIGFVTVTDEENYNSDGTFQYAYSIDLPAGGYDVTATSEGLTPIPKEVTVVDGLESDLDFDFDTEP